MSAVAYLGLGSNVGDRERICEPAIEGLGAMGWRSSRSPRYTRPSRSARSSTSPTSSTPRSRIRTELEPEELLDLCKAIEVEQGRMLGGQRHGPRPLDVDLLLLGDLELETERLTLPHPQVTRRRFVLEPLLELDPELALPDGTRLSEALEASGRGSEWTGSGRPASGSGAGRLRRLAAAPARPAAGSAAPRRGSPGTTRIASSPAGRAAIARRRSSRVISRRTLAPIWRSAAFGARRRAPRRRSSRRSAGASRAARRGRRARLVVGAVHAGRGGDDRRRRLHREPDRDAEPGALGIARQRRAVALAARSRGSGATAAGGPPRPSAPRPPPRPRRSGSAG